MNSLLEILKSCGDYFPHCFVIADVSAKDQPLVFINKHFTQLTGYTSDEVLGTNCRFMQGEKTNPENRAKIRTSLDNGDAIFQDILNYKKDGTPFWNRLMLIPIEYDVTGVRYYIGIQNDISSKKEKGFTGKGPEFINETATSTEVIQKIKNPLGQITNQLRAVRYFSDGSKDSKLEKEKLIESIVETIDKVCREIINFD